MRQVAALPYRHVCGAAGPIEVLLITGKSGRWIIPKGDIDDGMQPHRAAEQEAFEEGGIRGRIAERPIGMFRTCKQHGRDAIPAEVEVFPLEAHDELDCWPEMRIRQRRWFPIDEAADAVAEPELAAIMRKLLP